ncbi:helix-turn-helix domain-containing protein [Listeria innocua]|uniref:helix-turn-helix domain-containing protein n=1 Tax=Listeria innocua TaxID=1642 RepID=UPI0010BBFFFB|nr:helix-turn-helix transcriptional regulator [Listeria innocua]EAH4442085.1 XRE family transcriptional regulator [Listeria innocua]ECJ9370681.1 helix-turn-helix transcriptional regulator [Listeria innocua]EDO1163389.1 helix-turn-helix domain-containing protein [Listeria innocua]EDO1178096.1 helix-turn-helix domain-containing protein [Listeria innocua]EEU8425107.1 helix-turn-helix transcriptional regulator [Listeria innocua]
MDLIGLRIRNIRKIKQLTLKEAAKGIISVPYLANIENGVKVASFETLMHIAKRLEIPEEALLIGNEDLNKELLQELKQIFELLVFSNTKEVEDRLDKIAANVDLLCESPVIELSFYWLQAGFYYKTWEFSKAREIERTYLNSNEKRVVDSFPPDLLSYYYYGQAVKHSHATCDYQLAVEYWKKSIDLTDKAAFQVVFQVGLCINYICLNNYEPALKHIECAWNLIKRFPSRDQERITAILYLYGYINFQIGFMTEAKRKFEEVLVFFNMYPEAKTMYYFLVRFKLAEIERVEGNHELFDEKIVCLYEELMAHEASEIGFNNNDYLVITELMVIFAEQGSVLETSNLLAIINKVTEQVMEINFFVTYTETLLLYHQNKQSSYEKKMLDLLKKIDESNDPALIERVKKHASKHFADSTKYKMAYNILA